MVEHMLISLKHAGRPDWDGQREGSISLKRYVIKNPPQSGRIFNVSY